MRCEECVVKVLLSWMREFAPIEGDPESLAEAMTDLGMVVESTESVGPDWDGIVVAKVLTVAKHPEADRIQLVSVDAGDVRDVALDARVGLRLAERRETARAERVG